MILTIEYSKAIKTLMNKESHLSLVEFPDMPEYPRWIVDITFTPPRELPNGRQPNLLIFQRQIQCHQIVPKLRQLRHFLAVMDTKSYWRTAEQCSVTPQALSKSIRRFEESLGVRLFERIEGDFFTILGMPLLPVLAELRARGVLAT